MNKKGKGELTEALFIPKFLKMGYGVSIPFGNNLRYDMILDDGKKLLKVQCKTAWYSRGSIIFSTCSINGFTTKKTSYKGQVDLFAVYFSKLDKYYLIPIKSAKGLSMTLRVKRAKNYGNNKTINWAKNYEI